MGRKYSAERFYEAAELLRKHFPNAALTADLICGFPGEGEEEHREALDFIKKCRFYDMHIFPYSKRKYTKAEKMQGQNTKAVKMRRVREARALADEMKSEYLRAQVGQDLEVVFETEGTDIRLDTTPITVRLRLRPGQNILVEKSIFSLF